MQKSYNNIQETATCMNSYTKVHDQIFQRIYWPKQCQKMPNGLCKKKQLKTIRNTPKIQLFPHPYIYYKTSMKISVMVYKRFGTCHHSAERKMPVVGILASNTWDLKTSSEASTEISGMHSVHNILRHDDLEEPASLHHWCIVCVCIFSHTSHKHKSPERKLKSNWIREKVMKKLIQYRMA